VYRLTRENQLRHQKKERKVNGKKEKYLAAIFFPRYYSYNTKVANGGAEFVRRTEEYCRKCAGPKYLEFVGAGIMKPYELYLFFYNLLQVFGWGIILVKTFLGITKNQSNEELYNNVAVELAIFQTAAILEIIHAAIGFVRSPVATTATQVFSRVVVVWTILYKVPSSRSSIGVLMLLVAWSITEVIRYSFYALGLIKSVPFILTWMRYTFFIILYPMGASGEVLTMLAALPEIYQKKHLSFELPNSFNFGFSYYYFVILLCLYYIPGFPQLYLYMFEQRKKYVSGGGADSKKKIS
jgi:very-long-chain (3R)-3-hydroxyacyl-CoA dehydratase